MSDQFEDFEPDATSALPKGKRKCHRCGAPAHGLWVITSSDWTIELCSDHVPVHGPGLHKGGWFRVRFHDAIHEIQPSVIG